MLLLLLPEFFCDGKKMRNWGESVETIINWYPGVYKRIPQFPSFFKVSQFYWYLTWWCRRLNQVRDLREKSG